MGGGMNMPGMPMMGMNMGMNMGMYGMGPGAFQQQGWGGSGYGNSIPQAGMNRGVKRGRPGDFGDGDNESKIQKQGSWQ